MPTPLPRSALRHGSPTLSPAGSFQKLAKLGLMAIGNIPNLVRSHPTFAPPNGGHFVVAEEGEDPDAPRFWVYFSVAFTLVLLGGVFAGLTLG